jgi:hypothetical protein
MIKCYIPNMITVPDLVEEYVLNSIFLDENLKAGIINYTAFARQIAPYIKKRTLKNVNLGSIVMALRRLSKKMGRIDAQAIKYRLNNLTVRSDLIELTYLNSETIIEKHEKLINKIKNKQESFLTFTKGVYETTIILNSKMKDQILTIFNDEKMISIFENLTAITVRLPQNSIEIPGVHYNILKKLAWEKISIVESVSTFTEFSVILENKYLEKAFSVMTKLTAN